MKTLFGCVLIVLIFGECSTSVNSTTTGLESIKAHTSIAILPFEVRFDMRKKNRKEFTEKELSEVRHYMATALRDHLYDWLKNYSYRKSFSVTIQNPSLTDSILEAKQISFFVLYNMGRTELAKTLGVDAVLTPNVIFAQPNSEEASILLSAANIFNPSDPLNTVFFNDLATQEIKMQVLLNDRYSEKPMWTFETKTTNSHLTKQSGNNLQKNILAPLFENIDKTLAKFVRNFPYLKN